MKSEDELLTDCLRRSYFAPLESCCVNELLILLCSLWGSLVVWDTKKMKNFVDLLAKKCLVTKKLIFNREQKA